MLTVNSSNEYEVALSMHKDSIQIFNKILSEMYNFWEKRDYDVDIFYTDEYQKIKIKYVDGKQIDTESIVSFCLRFKLKLIKTSQTVEKDTMIGKYSQIIYYYFEGV